MSNFLRRETSNPKEEGSAWVSGLSASLPSLGMSGSTGTAAHTLLLLLLAPAWVCMYVLLIALCVLQLLALVHAMLWGCLSTTACLEQWECRQSPVHTELRCAECLRVAELTLLS